VARLKVIDTRLECHDNMSSFCDNFWYRDWMVYIREQI